MLGYIHKKAFMDRVYLLIGKTPGLRHAHAQLLYLLWLQIAENLGRVVL